MEVWANSSCTHETISWKPNGTDLSAIRCSSRIGSCKKMMVHSLWIEIEADPLRFQPPFYRIDFRFDPVLYARIKSRLFVARARPNRGDSSSFDCESIANPIRSTNIFVPGIRIHSIGTQEFCLPSRTSISRRSRREWSRSWIEASTCVNVVVVASLKNTFAYPRTISSLVSCFHVNKYTPRHTDASSTR